MYAYAGMSGSHGIVPVDADTIPQRTRNTVYDGRDIGVSGLRMTQVHTQTVVKLEYRRQNVRLVGHNSLGSNNYELQRHAFARIWHVNPHRRL